MLLFLAAALALWVLGWALGLPGQARWLLIGLLYVAIVAALVVLPEGAPLRAALGGSAGAWLAVGAVGAVGFAYSVGLKRLRKRVRPENRAIEDGPDPAAPFSETELERYARHIVLREIGGPGQRRFKSARVLVIGAGGLGAPALQYLAAAGVGTIGVIDGDVVENANLQRQVIHSERNLGMPKVFSAQQAMTALNPFVLVRPYHRRLTREIAADLFADYDLILDGSDNFDTRYLTNAACVAAGLPLIAAAITQWEGQISLYHPSAGGPCYRCVFPERPAPGLAPSCAEAGVIAPLPGVLGSMMALEALKHIAGVGETLRGRLLIFDGLFGESRRIAVARRPDCADCGGR